ncbi:hypothetical protein E1B28_010011 [Marasmius oreades]|uniref:Uncharacterized protein n=1 Tax=Marasmius oreades TaxID=181124 RepID=A0A9P7RW83_9AGAR|nr:uncharacterized protein E1B28_010011 [Marasmius oreades]KAG7090939.1 hypothetical protein E1B28_010011 [Marasmius oreades]
MATFAQLFRSIRALERPYKSRLTPRSFSTSTLRSNGSNDFIAGNAPSYQCYIFLHSSIPPSGFPSKLMTPLQRELQLRVLQWGGFVNWVYYGADALGSDPTQIDLDITLSATAFTSYGERIEIEELSHSNLDDVNAILKNAVQQPNRKLSVDQVHLLICTHMARDCRCGDLGSAYAAALRQEVEARRKLDEVQYDKFRIGEVGHVGQHKYAPNMLVYPRGDWLGRLKIKDIPETLNSIIDTSASVPFPDDICFSKHNWRGRMGLSKQEQLELFHSS